MKFTEITNNSQPIIYVDMDGVLADLFGHAANLHDVETYRHLTKDQFNRFFKENNAYELFKNLKPFPTTNQLLGMVVNLFGSYRILSSPLNFDPAGSIAGKKEWLEKYIKIPAELWIFDEEKWKYAQQSTGNANILIDDFGYNIKRWNESGGIGIKFQSDEDSLLVLEQKLKDIKSSY